MKEGRKGENTGATANIKHDLALEKVLVIVDEVPVRVRTDGIFEHGLMDVVAGVRLPVVLGGVHGPFSCLGLGRLDVTPALIQCLGHSGSVRFELRRELSELLFERFVALG